MRVLVVNAGSSSLKLARLDDDGAVTAATHGRALAGRGAPGAAARSSSATCGPVDAVGHRVVHGGPRHTEPVRRRRHAGRLPVLDQPPGAAAPARARWPASARSRELLPGRAGGGLLRHRLPRHAAAGGGDLRPAARVERALGAAPVRLPRALARLRRPARRGARRPARRGPADRLLPPRCRRLAGRRPRRGLGGHHDGVHAAGRAGDEHPARHRSTRACCCGCWSTAACPPTELADVLEHHAGLKGLSGTSGDLRDVLAGRAAGDADCALAFDVYVHRLAREIAAMTAATGGLDLLVLTGGVGEHAGRCGRRVADGSAHLGVAVDGRRNRVATGRR